MKTISIQGMLMLMEFFSEYAVRISFYLKDEIVVEMKDIHAKIQLQNKNEIRWEEYLQLIVDDDIHLDITYGEDNIAYIKFDKVPAAYSLH